MRCSEPQWDTPTHAFDWLKFKGLTDWIKSWQWYKGTRGLIQCQWECKTGKTVQSFLKMWNSRTWVREFHVHDAAIPVQPLHWSMGNKQMKNVDFYMSVHGSFIYNHQKLKTTQNYNTAIEWNFCCFYCSLSCVWLFVPPRTVAVWKGKNRVEYYLAIKKKELYSVTWMNLKIII